jgi:hypothetical protein
VSAADASRGFWWIAHFATRHFSPSDDGNLPLELSERIDQILASRDCLPL